MPRARCLLRLGVLLNAASVASALSASSAFPTTFGSAAASVNILIVNALYPPHRIGGAEKSVSLLAEGLARAGDRVTVATLDDIAAPTTERLTTGAEIHRFPLDNIYWPYGKVVIDRSAIAGFRWHLRNSWNRRAARRVGALMDQVRPDVIHCNVLTGFSNAVWSEASRRGIPIVQTLRDYAVVCVRTSLFQHDRTCTKRCAECRLLTFPSKKASRQVTQLVSISHFVDAKHREFGFFEGVPGRRIFNIIPDPQRDDAPPREGPLTFGYIGRVESGKGIEVVLDACSRLERADWRLRVAGVGLPSYVEELQRRYPDPRIEWLGFADSAAFYESIDVALISSIWPEPLTRTLIEATKFGRNVIAADSGGIPEIADLPRRSAVYPAYDSAALAAAMTTAIDERDDWRQGGVGRPDLLASFSEEAVVAAYRDVFTDAIAAKAAA